MEPTHSPDELRDGFARKAIELRDLAQVEIDSGNGDKLLSVSHLHAAKFLLKELQLGYPLRAAYQKPDVTWQMTYSELRRFSITILDGFLGPSDGAPHK